MRSTLQRISPEDGLVIIDIVNLPRVDDSPKGEEDKLLFPLKPDMYRALHVSKLFIGSLNIGPTWTKNSDAKNTDAKNTDAKNTDAMPKR